MLDFHVSRAVVVGIDDYGDGIPPLRTAVNDARRIGEALATTHGYTVTELTDGVSLARLTRLFAEELPAEIGRDDRLLVYFAGHGIALDGDDGPKGYLVPRDARRDDRATFLPMTDVAAWIEALTRRHLLLVLDCCFAGAFRWSSTRAMVVPPDVIHKERFDRFVRDPAWQVITSSAYDQRALDVLAGATIGLRVGDGLNADHSPFAAAFLRALGGAADVAPRGAGDGVVTATELYLYLRDCVELGAEGVGHRQTPGFWPLKKHDKGEYIHLVPGHPLNLPPAPPLDESTNPYRGLQSYDETHAGLFFGRNGFVKDLAGLVDVRPLTVVLGASGTGKSSVVKAGLLPALREKGPNAWSVAPPIRPGKSPAAALAALVIPGEPEGVAPGRPADEGGLASRVSAWAAREPGGRLLLVIDQLEELITLCRDPAERGSRRSLVSRQPLVRSLQHGGPQPRPGDGPRGGPDGQRITPESRPSGDRESPGRVSRTDGG